MLSHFYANMMKNIKYFLLLLSLFINNVENSTSVKKPNIVLILTDDQDYVLSGMTPMTSTLNLLAKRGTSFVNSFVAAPICCPSRSSILSGMYVHNHKTTNNSLSGGCSSIEWQKRVENTTFATILKKDGYTTFYGGKYLNEYGSKGAGGPQHVPPGWDVWRALIGNSKYYNFSLSRDGILKSYNNGEYLTDVVKDEALAFIDMELKRGLKKPLLMVISPPAPHAPFTPAPRHKNSFIKLKVEKSPNFNIPVGDDKHWLMREPPMPLPNSTIGQLDDIFRSRWETLLSVDETVEAVVKRLTSYNIVDNTYIIFTSDNGYHIGQFSQPFDKRQPYETDIKVPLIIRGPNVEVNALKHYPTVNIDLAPTILKMAGIAQPKNMDGLPLPIFTNAESDELNKLIGTNDFYSEIYDRQILIEYHGEGSHKNTSHCPASYDLNMANCIPEYFCKCQDSKNNSYSCIRHIHPMINFVYCAFNDSENFEEAYDINADPFQLANIFSELMPAIKFRYQNILKYLSTCKGSNCNLYNNLL